MRKKTTFVFFLFLFYSTSWSQELYPNAFHVNRGVTIGIAAAGAAASIAAFFPTRAEPDISDSEFSRLDRKNVPAFDSWVFNFDLPKHPAQLTMLGIATEAAIIALPFTLYLNNRIKPNWLDLLLMYMEMHTITVSIYQVSPLGTLFQDRYRPIVYYDVLPFDERRKSPNRNSFYSGHVATASASTFFMAKVYSDFHPELGNKKFLLYGAAAIPPLLLGYLRLSSLNHFPSDVLVGFGIGILTGILIPELHRIK